MAMSTSDRESLDLLIQGRSQRCGRHGENGDAEGLGKPAMRIEPAAHGRVVPVDRAEIEMDRGRRQARTSANLLQGGFEIVAHRGWAQVLAILDDRQLELVELQFGDQAKGLLQRLPRKAECAASDEHRPLLSFALSPLPGAHRTEATKFFVLGRSDRVRQGEKTILLTLWGDLTLPCDQAIGQKPRLVPTAPSPQSRKGPRAGSAG